MAYGYLGVLLDSSMSFIQRQFVDAVETEVGSYFSASCKNLMAELKAAKTEISKAKSDRQTTLAAIYPTFDYVIFASPQPGRRLPDFCGSWCCTPANSKANPRPTTAGLLICRGSRRGQNWTGR